MSGGTNRPFREPCGAVGFCNLGSPFAHARHGDAGIKRFINTTSPPPTEQFAPDNGSACATFGTPTGAPYAKPYATQTFAQDGTTDFSVCHKKGFKNVHAFRNWNGRWGFIRDDAGTIIEICGDGKYNPSLAEPQPVKVHRPAVLSPTQTKYRTMDVSASANGQDLVNSPPNDTLQTVEIKATVDANSGMRSVDPASFSVSPNDEGNYALGLLGLADSSVSPWDFFLHDYSELYGSMTDVTISATELIGKDVDGNILVHNVISSGGSGNWSSGHVSRTLRQNLEGIGWTTVMDEFIDWSDSSFEYQQTEYAFASPTGSLEIATTILTKTVTCDLSDEYTAQDLQSDMKDNLLSAWPLDDDHLYPYRTDNAFGIAPLVSRDEYDGLQDIHVSSGWWYCRDADNPILTFTNITDGWGNQDASSGGFSPTTPSPGPPNSVWSERFQIQLCGNQDSTSYTFYYSHTYNDGDTVNQLITIPGGARISSVSMTGGNLYGLSFSTSTYRITGTVNFAGTDAESDNGYVYLNVTVAYSEPLHDGSILGAPQPAGYEDWFDFQAQHITGCITVCCGDTCTDAYVWSWNLYSWGNKSSMYEPQVPKNATQWTNWLESASKYPGAFITYNDPVEVNQIFQVLDCDGNLTTTALTVARGQSNNEPQCWMCKSVTIQDLWPSQNFARPAGEDKFLVDETKVYYAANIVGSGAGSTWTITDVDGATPTISDTSGYWGGQVFGGFYEITSYSAGILTLGAKKYDLPGGWVISQGQTGDDADGAFGQLKWPTAPALLGAISITAVNDAGGHVPTDPLWTPTYQFDSSQTNFGLDSATHQESIDLMSADAANKPDSVLSTQTATRVDDSKFTVPISVANAKYAMIHGAEKWYMNDSTPKGDCAVLDWLWDFTTNAEYARLDGVVDCSSTQVTRPAQNYGFAEFNQTAYCIPFTACAPKVIAIGCPEFDGKSNVIYVPFPTIDFDEENGSKWQAIGLATMNDALWQAPHNPNATPSVSLVLWKEDGMTDGNLCHADGDESDPITGYGYNFYPHRPEVECRLTLPSNYGLAQNETPADALGAYAGLGFVSPVTHSNGQKPPAAMGVNANSSPATIETESSLHEKMCAVDVSCRFYSFYHPMQLGC